MWRFTDSGQKRSLNFHKFTGSLSDFPPRPERVAGLERMPARFINIDHDAPLLLPPDLRAWVPEDHLVYVIMDAVGLHDLSVARVNH